MSRTALVLLFAALVTVAPLVQAVPSHKCSDEACPPGLLKKLADAPDDLLSDDGEATADPDTATPEAGEDGSEGGTAEAGEGEPVDPLDGGTTAPSTTDVTDGSKELSEGTGESVQDLPIVGCDESATSVRGTSYDIKRDGVQPFTVTSLAHVLSGDRVRASFWVVEACLQLQVALASYVASAPDADPLQFLLQDVRTGTFAAGQHTLPWVKVPSCQFRIDLVVGPAFTGAALADGEGYGERWIDGHHGGDAACPPELLPPAEGELPVPPGQGGDPPGQGGGVPTVPDLPSLPGDPEGPGAEPGLPGGTAPAAPHVPDGAGDSAAAGGAGGGGGAVTSPPPPPEAAPPTEVLPSLPPIGYLRVSERLVLVGDDVVLDAGYSYSPIGGSIEAYRFLLPDGSWTPWGPDPVHRFTATTAGDFRVAVQVRDTFGLESTNPASTRIHVLDEGMLLDAAGALHAVPAPPTSLVVLAFAGLAGASRLRRPKA